MLRAFTTHWRPIVSVIAGALAIWIVALIAIPKIAFGRDKVAKDLADAVSGHVRFRSFRNVYFPHPGCVAEGVTIERGSDEHVSPLISISKLTVIGSYSTILSKRVSWMKAEGLVVTPSGNAWPENRSKSSIIIEHFIADNATLQVPGSSKGRPIKFTVHHFSLDDLGSDRAMPFEVTLSNPLPPGEITSQGKLGPWNRKHEETPVEGIYSLRGADLSAFHGVAGVLSSDGKFRGSIRELQISGKAETPKFEIVSNHHGFPLSTQFQAQVNATNGDIILQDVRAKLAETALHIQGAVVPDPEHRRTAILDIVSQEGRIEDILFPFVHSPRSPIHGVTSWRAHIVLPSGNSPFERKVQLDGDFGIADAHFTDPHTQEKLDKASEQARGNPNDPDPSDVVSDLKGHVLLKDGSATFSRLSFAVPGAQARMHGTFNILDERIDLHGTVRLQARISKATTGIKSFLLKALSPFIKKDKPQEPLPIAITGTYNHPQYSISVTKK